MIQIGHDADGRMLIRMALREEHRLHIFHQRAVGRVLHVKPMLFFDDSALGAHILLVHAQRGHAVGFQPEDPIQGIAGNRLKEECPVEEGVGVVVAADLLDIAGMLFRADMRRAFEHQVLEQVRKPGLARRFVLAADVIPDLQGDDGRAMVFERYDFQPVRQCRHLKVEARRFDRREGGGGRIRRLRLDWQGQARYH